MNPPRHVVVMGVAGSGKSLVGAELAARLEVAFVEGDELHPRENVEKMRSGVPLSDDERWPWLAAIRQEMRERSAAVVTCSALRRSYRDALRAAGDVGFVFLSVDRSEAERRARLRSGHFMAASMVDSQFADLELPGIDEADVATVDASSAPADVVDAAVAAVAELVSGTTVAPVAAWGGPSAVLGREHLGQVVDEIAREVALARARRVLLVPPDHTRLSSRAGELTAMALEALEREGVTVRVLPATGTHRAMSSSEIRLMFGDRVPQDRVLGHDWRGGVVKVGEISSDEVHALSAGRLRASIPVAIDAELLGGWDLVVSLGQVLPHEVVGMANFTKNLVIGLGGAGTIDQTHLLGALCDMETIMGRAASPVRDVVDAAFDRLLAPDLRVLWVLTVVEHRGDGTVLRGVFTGRGGSGETGGAAYRAAATLAATCNVEVVPTPLQRVSCYLDPAEFHSTWLGNKAIYRTRMALADGAELVVLAPGVSRFGEDPAIDALVRRHGYRGTPAVIDALARDVELAANASAAAHLVHGSSEGRFSVTYCTDPDRGGLRRDEVEAVGYDWRLLPEALEALGVDEGTPTGERVAPDGSVWYHIANPALGLWCVDGRLVGS